MQLLCLMSTSSSKLSFQFQTQIIHFHLDISMLRAAHPGICSELNLTFMNIIKRKTVYSVAITRLLETFLASPTTTYSIGKYLKASLILSHNCKWLPNPTATTEWKTQYLVHLILSISQSALISSCFRSIRIAVGQFFFNRQIQKYWDFSVFAMP